MPLIMIYNSTAFLLKFGIFDKNFSWNIIKLQLLCDITVYNTIFKVEVTVDS